MVKCEWVIDLLFVDALCRLIWGRNTLRIRANLRTCSVVPKTQLILNRILLLLILMYLGLFRGRLGFSGISCILVAIFIIKCKNCGALVWLIVLISDGLLLLNKSASELIKLSVSIFCWLLVHPSKGTLLRRICSLLRCLIWICICLIVYWLVRIRNFARLRVLHVWILIAPLGLLGVIIRWSWVEWGLVVTKLGHRRRYTRLGVVDHVWGGWGSNNNMGNLINSK